MSTAQPAPVRIRLDLHDGERFALTHVADALVEQNAASPAIDSHDAQRIVEKWINLAVTSRSYIQTPSGIVITHSRQGEYAPTMQLWPQLADGMFATGDCPIDGMTLTVFRRDISDTECLDAVSEILTEFAHEDIAKILDAIGNHVARTGRAA